MDLTQDTDVNGYIDGTTTLSTEKETKLKKLLKWGIGQKAIHSMTRKLHNEPIESMNYKKISRTLQKPLHDGQKPTTQPNRFLWATALRKWKSGTNLGKTDGDKREL